MQALLGHAGLIAKASGPAPVSPIKSQLNFEGSNGSTTFTDETGRTWTRVGTPTISTAWSAGGSSSGYFPGTGCIKTEDVGGLTMLDWKTDSFRIEFDLYATGAPGIAFVVTKRSTTGTYPAIEISHVGGKLGVNMSSNDVQYYTAMATAISLNTAYKVKVERIGTSLKMYLDGVEAIVSTIPATITHFGATRDSPVCIGSIGDGSYPFYGYVDNFVITKL